MSPFGGTRHALARRLGRRRSVQEPPKLRRPPPPCRQGAWAPQTAHVDGAVRGQKARPCRPLSASIATLALVQFDEEISRAMLPTLGGCTGR
jgi:hypothetical protein